MSKKKKSRKWKKILAFTGIFLLLVFLFTGSLGVSAILFNRQKIAYASQLSENKIAEINEDTFRKTGPTIIYDKDGKEISRMSALDYSYTGLQDIPELMKAAFIATEDRDFYKHGAISIKGMGRALFSAVKNKGKIEQGGSTITQQLVRNVFLTMDRTWERKYTEILMSQQLEKKYNKDQILEFYLNNINFANGAYSVATAAHTYFNKQLKDLNLAETTFIAAIPNNPTYYNPLKYYDHVVKRQRLMLLNLKEQNYITEQQYQEALNAKVTLNYQPHQNPAEDYVTSYAVDCAVRAFMKNDGFQFRYNFISDEDRKSYENLYKDVYEDYDKRIRNGGFNIYTSLDMDKQDQLQSALDSGLASFKDTEKNGLYKMQGAAVSVDNATGEVIAAVGGRSQKNVTNYFNRAFLAVRQPGSSIKPVLVYTPSFDKGFSPDSIITDQYIPNGPKNSEDAFFGPVTLRYATEMSLNTVAYQLLIKEGINYALPYLYKMNFSHIVKQDSSSPIIAIGGFTYGVTPVEMAGAYSTLARGGEFIEPTCLRKLTEADGELIYENPHSKVRIYKEDSAYYMTDVLKGVISKSWATGYGLSLNNMPAAGKTGTTSDSKDGWFAGYTPYMTTVVWVGYDTPTSVPSLYGATYPGRIWKTFMNTAHKGLASKEFDIPKVVQDAIKAKAEADAQKALKDAEAAVTAYEAMHIISKADYEPVAAAVQAAQEAVNKVAQDKRQDLQNRINVKTDALNKEKLTLEAEEPSPSPSPLPTPKASPKPSPSPIPTVTPSPSPSPGKKGKNPIANDQNVNLDTGEDSMIEEEYGE